MSLSPRILQMDEETLASIEHLEKFIAAVFPYSGPSTPTEMSTLQYGKNQNSENVEIISIVPNNMPTIIDNGGYLQQTIPDLHMYLYDSTTA